MLAAQAGELQIHQPWPHPQIHTGGGVKGQDFLSCNFHIHQGRGCPIRHTSGAIRHTSGEERSFTYLPWS